MTIIADTGAMLALLDADEIHHRAMARLYARHSGGWVVPAAIIPELDYLVATHLGAHAQAALLADLGVGAFVIEWNNDRDMATAARLHDRYRALQLGWVDSMVVATAERLDADAIATLDLRHFGAIAIEGDPRLYPRDL